MARLTDTSDPKSLSNVLRRKRDVALRQLISAVSATQGSVSILDIGGTTQYWDRVGLDFLRDVKATVTVLNLPGVVVSTPLNDVVTHVTGNACDLSNYADQSFDISHSNSVIEHVGSWENMKLFAKEAKRVSRFYYIQTPYYWFPIDPHFYQMPLYHWFPRPIKTMLLRTFPIGHAGRAADLDSACRIAESSSLLDRQQMSYLFRDAQIRFERFCGLRKSVIAVAGPTH